MGARSRWGCLVKRLFSSENSTLLYARNLIGCCYDWSKNKIFSSWCYRRLNLKVQGVKKIQKATCQELQFQNLTTYSSFTSAEKVVFQVSVDTFYNLSFCDIFSSITRHTYFRNKFFWYCIYKNSDSERYVLLYLHYGKLLDTFKVRSSDIQFLFDATITSSWLFLWSFIVLVQMLPVKYAAPSWFQICLTFLHFEGILHNAPKTIRDFFLYRYRKRFCWIKHIDIRSPIT